MKRNSFYQISLIFLLAWSGPGMLLAAGAAGPAVEQVRQAGDFEQGQEYYGKGAFEEALASLQRAASTEPNRAEVYYYLGLTYQGMLQFPEAEEALGRSVELNPSDGNAHAHLGETRYRLGKYDEAKASLQLAEANGARPAYVAYMKGLVLLELADYDGAIGSLKAAGELDPEFRQKATYAMGMVYSRQQNKEAASQALRQAVAMNPDSSVGVYANLSLQSMDRPKKSPLHVTLGYGLHYDDNVVLKPTTAASGAFPSGKADFTHVFTAQASYTPELSGMFGIRADATIYKSLHHKLGNMDVDGASASLTPSLSTGLGTLSVEGRGEYYYVGRHRYLSMTGVYPSFSFVMGERHQGVLHGDYQKKQFMHGLLIAGEDRDATHGSAGYSHYIFSDDRDAYLSLDYTYDGDNARGNNWDYIGHRFSIAALYPLDNGFSLRFNGDYYQQNYDKVHSIFGVKQRDRTYTFSPTVTYDLKWVNVLLQYSHVQAKSNIQIYRYKRNICGVGLEYTY